MPKDLIQLQNLGIKCDNDDCDFTAALKSPDEYHAYLNKPCPKCGENLLTEEDYQTMMDILIRVELANQNELPDVHFPPEVQALVDGLSNPNELADLRIDFVDGVPVMSSTNPDVQAIVDKILELSLKQEG